MAKSFTHSLILTSWYSLVVILCILALQVVDPFVETLVWKGDNPPWWVVVLNHPLLTFGPVCVIGLLVLTHKMEKRW